MNRGIAFPFLTLSYFAVRSSEWAVSVNGGDWIDAGEYLGDFDAASTVEIRRTIQVDSLRAGADLEVPEDQLQLAAAVQVGTGLGRLPRRIVTRQRWQLNLASPACELELRLSGKELSGVLDLHTEILLAAEPRTFTALSPRSPADRLWEDRTRIRLEGEEPRFPMEITDLKRILQDTIAASAPWYLHWSPRDWDRDLHGAIRLYLNQCSTDFLGRLQTLDGASLQALLADVMGQICERFVLDPQADEMMESSEPGSLGAQAAAWLRKAWPSGTAPSIRAELEDRPGSFRSTLLALADLGEG